MTGGFRRSPAVAHRASAHATGSDMAMIFREPPPVTTTAPDQGNAAHPANRTARHVSIELLNSAGIGPEQTQEFRIGGDDRHGDRRGPETADRRRSRPPRPTSPFAGRSPSRHRVPRCSSPTATPRAQRVAVWVAAVLMKAAADLFARRLHRALSALKTARPATISGSAPSLQRPMGCSVPGCVPAATLTDTALDLRRGGGRRSAPASSRRWTRRRGYVDRRRGVAPRTCWSSPRVSTRLPLRARPVRAAELRAGGNAGDIVGELGCRQVDLITDRWPRRCRDQRTPEPQHGATESLALLVRAGQP